MEMPPPAAATPMEVSPPASTGAMVSGTGTTGSGSVCACSCFCGLANFPSAVQGLEGFGGLSGKFCPHPLLLQMNP
jgi:hypothetical protein